MLSEQQLLRGILLLDTVLDHTYTKNNAEFFRIRHYRDGSRSTD